MSPIQAVEPIKPEGADPVINEEMLLISAFDDIRENRLDHALSIMKQLTIKAPKFTLAHLIYADLLLAKTQTLQGFGHLTPSSEKIDGMLEEARKRWTYHISKPSPNMIPDQMSTLDKSTRHAVLVDLTASRFYVFENQAGVPVLVKDHYTSMGKKGARKYKRGDQRTPVGVYHITEYLPEPVLADRYGVGAFPINYPNDWDRKMGKTGGGIWLHGTSFATYSRPPKASDGCVTLSNENFSEIRPLLDIKKTPVVITSHPVTWLSKESWQARQDEMTVLIEQWRQHWESNNTDLYLSHYSKDFKGSGKDYKGWVAHKRRVNGRKKYINVNLLDLYLTTYPGDEAMMLRVTFKQDYKSDNFSSQSRKQQYWRLEEDGVWRIISEG
jgi:murein L,D-transpeptidase YafK